MKSIVRTIVSLCGVVGVLAVGLGAADGVLIVQQSSTGGGAPETNQIQIEKTRMRAEMAGPTGTKQAVVFDGAKQAIYMINSERKTYSEMTKADVDRIAAQVDAGMAAMKEQMANIPPEQRAQVEAMMKGRGMSMPGMGGPASKTAYKRTGTDKVGKWTCDKYEGTRDGQKVSELCTVNPSALGLTAADFEVTRQFAEMFKKILPQIGNQAFGIGRQEDQGFSGIPVRSTTTTGGRTTVSEIKEVSRQAFADSVFAIPAGFQKTELMPGMGGRGRGRQ